MFNISSLVRKATKLKIFSVIFGGSTATTPGEMVYKPTSNGEGHIYYARLNAVGSEVEEKRLLTDGDQNAADTSWMWFHFKFTDGSYAYDSNYGEVGVVIWLPNTPDHAIPKRLTWRTSGAQGQASITYVDPFFQEISAIAMRFAATGPQESDELSLYVNGVKHFVFEGIPQPATGISNYLLGIQIKGN